ncbi:MAG: response regulator [Gemmatimonadaceae bacterium]|nr:response regulator [Gemmatimonadaceae bacterium]
MSRSVPSAPRRWSPFALWRTLPFTAQLLALGMMVGLFWFLASRAAAERQQQAVQERTAQLVELQRAALLAAQLGRGIVEMSRDHRGYLITGDAAFVASFGADSARMAQTAQRLLRSHPTPAVSLELDRIDAHLQTWLDVAVTPSRRGPPPRGPVQLASAHIDSALAAQARLERHLEVEVAETELLADAAATRDDLSTFLASTGGLAVLILLLMLLMRFVGRTLDRIVEAAEAIDAGRYRAAAFPRADEAPNRETATLARAFEQLAESTARREAQLQDDVERLTEMERLKRDFVSTVSHELRTPLTSMRGALGLILGGRIGDVPAKVRELLQIAMSNTERLIRLVNDILDVEKIDAGAMQVRREPMRLRGLLQHTMVLLDSFARDHGVRLELTSGGRDADIVGDPDRLTQVFTNLVSNAVKFSPSGTTVSLSLAASPAGVTVRVRDHGPGVPPEFAPRLFGRFQQAERAESRRPGGTGLGLNIARTLVEQHGGAIGFDPADGGGAVFWVTLPASAIHEEEAAAPAPADPRRVVLIIEDDPSMREVLTAMVEPIARALPVGSGEEAFAALAHEPVGAVILDLELPGMHGFEFSRRLRQDPALRKLPVLLFSAREHGTEELRAAGIRAADAFVKTRDSEQVLFERLRKELGIPR